MKIHLRKLFSTMLLLLSNLNVFAGSPPPPPDNDDPVPINQEIYLLITIAIVYGLYIMYKYKSNQKTPV